ncbi:helix-turn-helix domain-containing protein [Streptomyces catenulae]|uniref:Helix-turn-helix domain-containing protein n=1 Tax=Streptomyces catenulae TaxID=66875 RepID=A0ABV2YYW4_9ACTN|nr:helix-turn-helix transcriptional regulator [Streptomyces catenulae]
MAGAFGEVLRRLRSRTGLTQEELAERSGVSVRTIRGLETGSRVNPRMTTVQELARALPLAPDERGELLRAALGGEARRGLDGAEVVRDGGAPEVVPGEEVARGAGPGPVLGTARGASVPGTVPDASAPGTNRGAGTTPASPGEAARPAADIPSSPDLSSTSAPPPASGPLADAVEQLAGAVAARWRREEEQRQIQDPFPLPVRWRAAAEELADHWANIRRLPPGAAAGPLALEGRLDGVAALYRRVPSGRLVVLGRSGSGKTVLALRFVLDHLASRTAAEPVPVIFSIGAWNPTAVPLRDWLADRLIRDHPGYAAQGPGGTTLAAALVESGRVLPVLDGFDEMAAGLRRPALEALNATTLPLLLTSRPAEYAAAVAETDVLTSAAAVELTDLTLDDLAAYLPRTTRKPGRARPAANAWEPVLTALRAHPAPPLAAVLTNPLMVALARAVYSDTPDHDPAELLDGERFGGPEALEDHLLESFLPTVYRRPSPSAPGARPRRAVAPDRARHWLGHLAHHLHRLETPDLAWWRLGGGLRRGPRTAVTALVTGVAIGLADAALAAAVGGPYPLVDGAVVGLLAGLMFGLVYWLTFAVRDVQVAPSAVRLRLGRGAPRGTAGPRLVVGTLGGGVFGLGYGLVVGLMQSRFRWPGGLRYGLIDGTFYGLVFSVAAGLSFCLLSLVESPLDLRSAAHPRGLLRTHRATVLTRLAVWAPLFGALVGGGAAAAVDLLRGVLGPLLWSPAAGLVLGTLSGVGGALGYVLALTAWGQWLVLGRFWLPLTGRLPWAVTAFLDDAYRRGVLRQAGAVYQFRHARLQHHLARAHRTAPGRGGPRR